MFKNLYYTHCKIYFNYISISLICFQYRKERYLISRNWGDSPNSISSCRLCKAFQHFVINRLTQILMSFLEFLHSKLQRQDTPSESIASKVSKNSGNTIHENVEEEDAAGKLCPFESHFPYLFNSFCISDILFIHTF